jgi:hypothetical protein
MTTHFSRGDGRAVPLGVLDLKDLILRYAREGQAPAVIEVLLDELCAAVARSPVEHR